MISPFYIRYVYQYIMALKLLQAKGDYVTLKNNTEMLLKIDKIINVEFRKAYLYWNYPYVMTINYSKNWSQQYYMHNPVLKIPMPVTISGTTKEFAFKIKDMDHAKQFVKEWKMLNVEIQSDLDFLAQKGKINQKN